jgi:hypothetical protein
MSNLEHLPQITVKEAISRIIDSAAGQKGNEEGKSNSNRLKSAMVFALDAFKLGDVQIKRTIFIEQEPTASGNDAFVATKTVEKQAKNIDYTFSFNEREITFKGGEKEIMILKALVGTSEKHPISMSALAKGVYGDEIPLKVAKGRVNAMLSILREKLRGYDLAIVKKSTGRKEMGRDGRKGDRSSYYLANKDDSVKENFGEKLAESRVVITTAPITNNPQKEKKELGSSFFLTDNEIYVIAERLLYLQVKDGQLLINSNVDMRLFDREEIKSLMGKLKGDIRKGRVNESDLERESLLPIRNKLEFFAIDKKKYFDSCGELAQILLSYFMSAEIDKTFLEKLLETKPALVYQSIEKMEV